MQLPLHLEFLCYDKKRIVASAAYTILEGPNKYAQWHAMVGSVHILHFRCVLPDVTAMHHSVNA